MARSEPPIRFGVGVTDLTKLSRDLRAVDADLQAGFRDVLKEAVEPVVEQARSNVSWSQRIGSSIRVIATGGRANVRVAVRAGGPRAPEAAAFEHGGWPGKFRHPVFGHRGTWVDQPARPFLYPALLSKASPIADAVEKAIDKYLTAHGL